MAASKGGGRSFRSSIHSHRAWPGLSLQRLRPQRLLLECQRLERAIHSRFTGLLILRLDFGFGFLPAAVQIHLSTLFASDGNRLRVFEREKFLPFRRVDDELETSAAIGWTHEF